LPFSQAKLWRSRSGAGFPAKTPLPQCSISPAAFQLLRDIGSVHEDVDGEVRHTNGGALDVLVFDIRCRVRQQLACHHATSCEQGEMMRLSDPNVHVAFAKRHGILAEISNASDDVNESRNGALSAVRGRTT
jgi:hypothetical protein